MSHGGKISDSSSLTAELSAVLFCRISRI
jgi:hypothetical protein